MSLIMDIALALFSAVILYIMNTLFIVVLILTIISAALIYIQKNIQSNLKGDSYTVLVGKNEEGIVADVFMELK
ncbi:hypothetical protein G9F73_002530 [Clostridium estertheticum]|uniref:hypothetical protein n=1 Tax=Clostridium estertheticum TaxID=238834 RepID=UPI0013EE66D4|nr:hypothetical protein [Clostridium estertheticum]MBZ9606713.1 hypothetical protein [Clostridium estertheticum]